MGAIMDIERAKEIIGSYVDYNTSEDLRILGREHPHEAFECTVGEVRDAFDLLDKHYNYFTRK